MRDIGSHAPRLKVMRRPKALGSRRSGRAGEPAVGESVRASESLADVPHRPRLASYPPNGPSHRLPDLYGSLLKDLWYYLIPITPRAPGRADLPSPAEAGRAKAGLPHP